MTKKPTLKSNVIAGPWRDRAKPTRANPTGDDADADEAGSRDTASDKLRGRLGGRLAISVLGELTVHLDGAPAQLPPSRKARALFAYLVVTGRPHRRERLCELFWDLPDDPRASLRWALSKLRAIVDTPGRARIIADRERVAFDGEGIELDLRLLEDAAQDGGALPLAVLTDLAEHADHAFLEGLEAIGAGDFAVWLAEERQNARDAHVAILQALVSHHDVSSAEQRKWTRKLRAHRAVADSDADASDSDAPSGLDPEDRVRSPVTGDGGRALRDQKVGFCRARDGTRIAFATIGSGPPILKAANWLTHLEFDWSAPIWGRSFSEIARRYTFVRYDERGCGLSDWDVKDLSFEAFVEDLEAVVDALGLTRFPLIGISQGAAVSIEYAVRHPDRISALILVSGYAAGWRIGASPEEQARREAVLTLTELGWGTENPAYRHIFSQTFMPDARSEELAWFDEFQRRTTSPRNAARFQEAFGHIDVRDRLAQVKAPTIVFHSREDQRIPFSDGLHIAKSIPGAEFVPLTSRNHILVENEPALDVFIDRVHTFLARTIGG